MPTRDGDFDTSRIEPFCDFLSDCYCICIAIWAYLPTRYGEASMRLALAPRDLPDFADLPDFGLLGSSGALPVGGLSPSLLSSLACWRFVHLLLVDYLWDSSTSWIGAGWASSFCSSWVVLLSPPPRPKVAMFFCCYSRLLIILSRSARICWSLETCIGSVSLWTLFIMVEPLCSRYESSTSLFC